MNINKLLEAIRDMPIEFIAQAQINLDELVELHGEICLEGLLLSLPLIVKNCVNDIAEVRLQAMKTLVETVRKKSKSNIDIMEIKKEIGVVEVEDEIVRMLPANIDLLSHQASARLEILYNLIESKIGFNSAASLNHDDEIILKILSPIDRLKSCLLTKRDKELKISDQIKKIKDEVLEEEKKIKRADGYDAIENDAKKFSDAIDDLMEKISVVKQSEQTDADRERLLLLEDEKDKYVFQYKERLSQLMQLDIKYKDQIEIIQKLAKEKIAEMMKPEIEEEKIITDNLHLKLRDELIKLKEAKQKKYDPLLMQIKAVCDEYYGYLFSNIFDGVISLDEIGPTTATFNVVKSLLEIFELKDSPYSRHEKFKHYYEENRKNFSMRKDLKTKEFLKSIDTILYPPGYLMSVVYSLFAGGKHQPVSASVVERRESVMKT